MSKLGEQIKELREAAFGIQGDLGRCLYRRKDIDKMLKFSDLLFEAANTIESLQELQGVASESRYTELFGTPERAARALENGTPMCDWCDKQACEENGGECSLFDYDALLEWLRGDA